MNNALMTLPVCPSCPEHGQLKLRVSNTSDQQFCGVWYDCGQCHSSVLLPSKELNEFLKAGAKK